PFNMLRTLRNRTQAGLSGVPMSPTTSAQARVVTGKSLFFFFLEAVTTEIYTLSLHDALPILVSLLRGPRSYEPRREGRDHHDGRSEEHTSELQSPCNLVCCLLLEKKMPANARARIDTPTKTFISKALPLLHAKQCYFISQSFL